MSGTKIEWADQVWNPCTGCTPISEGCANCWAKRRAETRLRGRFGYPPDEPFKPGTFHPNKLDEPYHYRKPKKFFVVSMGDLFHEDVRQKIIADIFDIAYRAYIQYGHTFIFLTKRPQRMNDETLVWSAARGISLRALDGFWLGVTAENQRTADERIPILLQIPAAKHFVSVEPMLEPVDLKPWLYIAWQCSRCKNYFPNPWKKVCPVCGEVDYWSGSHIFNPPHGQIGSGLSWVIAGPETGPRARPTSIDWVRDLQRQCRAACVPFFDKKDVLGETIQEWPQ